MPPVRLKIRSAALDANLDQPFDIDEPDHLFAGCSSSGKGWSAWWPVLTSLCWLARYSQVIAFAAALLAGLPGKNSATPAMFARDWQIFKFILAHDLSTDQLAYHSFKIARIVIGLKSAILALFGAAQLPRNGAVASAVLVQPHALASAFSCIGTGPLRRALARATRSGTAGVGHLLAIRRERYAVSADVL